MIVLDTQIDSTLLTARGMRQVSKAVNRLVMTEFRNEFLPKHFMNVPETRPGGAYGYRPRTKGTQISKAKEFGTTAPLVQTGKLRQSILASAKVTADAYGAKMIARASTKTPISPAVVKELEAVADAEKQKIAERWQEAFLVLAQRPEYQRKQRHRNAAGRFTRG